MANVETQGLVMRNTIHPVTFTTCGASAEHTLEWNGKDDQTVVVIQNAGSSSTTIQLFYGDSFGGKNEVGGEAITVPVGISLIKLDSARFKNVGGAFGTALKGKVHIRAVGAVNIAVVKMV